MKLQRIEDQHSVAYKRNGELVGVIRYNHPAPSTDALDTLSKRILQLYKESLKAQR